MTSLLHSRWAPGNSDYDPYNQYDNPSSSNGTHHQPRTNTRNQSSKSKSPHTHSIPASPARPSYTKPPSQSSPLPPSEELARFIKITARLRWKLPFLAEAYRLATATPINPEAEIMFKIDFFEYYALLERCIVHLLAVFNITVSSSRGRPPPTPVYTATTQTGRVFEQLRQAKELRNRWKTADMTAEQVLRDPVGDRDVVRPLESYDLEGILGAIFGGLEEGFVRAREHVKLCMRVGEDVVDAGREEGWEFMVDAMDWEAV
ncbi:uncharacterized protein N7496_012399 [Penicillium cataractarum]|uniref:Uncharacterized protein n=1 Tax=Penicillium cataractarum TaxID=2100454 RepID=A0A9W9R7I2_9EURO|nr:uncharacterized protein N7496_012399 [Penicillium cataractarum]KAJ5355187.1 hypothetical protein N7496_012399 [Penicillium cataractarum]